MHINVPKTGTTEWNYGQTVSTLFIAIGATTWCNNDATFVDHTYSHGATT